MSVKYSLKAYKIPGFILLEMDTIGIRYPSSGKVKLGIVVIPLKNFESKSKNFSKNKAHLGVIFCALFFKRENFDSDRAKSFAISPFVFPIKLI